MDSLSLTKKQQALFSFLSLLIVAFGQPAWSAFLSLLSACFGFALAWRVVFSFSSKKKRFLFAFLWFSAVQLIQLSWLNSHPYSYIYAVWILFSLAVGAQFGLLTFCFVSRKTNDSICLSLPRIFMIASCWVLFEWSRLFFLSGYVWNPVGLSLGANVYSLQFASVVGVYGLSLLVILMNLFVLRAWLLPAIRPRSTFYFLSSLSLPLLFGFVHLSYHQQRLDRLEKENSPRFSVILVQPAFPVEESLNLSSRTEFLDLAFQEWKTLIALAAKHYGKPVDLIVFPEMVVPFGTYSWIYEYDSVKSAFETVFGSSALKKLPQPVYPLAHQLGEEKRWMVNNAYFAQALANIFSSGVLIGLEDAEDKEGTVEYYSAAIYMTPQPVDKIVYFAPNRYAKRVLVPMGEYIPLEFCRNLAGRYGVFGSFTPGEKAMAWDCGNLKFGVSICYEEMFGDLMRENRNCGSELLLNLTSDAWFPNSKLIRQHLEHSRLRTVEAGVPLARACNTGVTCVIDALGRDVAVLGENDEERELLSDSLYVSFFPYEYQTIYEILGDRLIIGLSLAFCLLFFLL